MLKNDENADERGALVLRARCAEARQVHAAGLGLLLFRDHRIGDTVRLEFQRRTIRERVALWRRKWGL